MKTLYFKTLILGIVLFFLPLPLQAVKERSVGSIQKNIIRSSLDFISIPYVWGGATPRKGFDCSGFVKYVYKKESLDLPRVSREMFRKTGYVKPKAVQPGDLIFFSMKKPASKKIDHVGIYLGKDYFIHASFTKGVIVDRLSKPYFFKRILGIRRHRRLL